MDSLKAIGKFDLLERIGRGGFSAVYKCRHRDTGVQYAIKIGSDSVNEEYKDHQDDIDNMVHMQEWHAYKAIGFGKDGTPGIPEVIETGIAKLPSKELRPYLVLQLLGRSLSSVLGNKKFTMAQIFKVSHCAIDILKHIHEAGYVHRDIKPSNFCFGETAKEQERAPLFVLDLGLACKRPEKIDRRVAEFAGTPDYSSTAALKSACQSYRDDMESLAYTVVEMWLGDLPWYLTNSQSMKGCPWNKRTLRKMAEKRDKLWKKLIQEKRIPSFLIVWVNRCKSMGMLEMPDYDYFHDLLKEAESQMRRHNEKNKRKQEDRFSSGETDTECLNKRRCLPEE